MTNSNGQSAAFQGLVDPNAIVISSVSDMRTADNGNDYFVIGLKQGLAFPTFRAIFTDVNGTGRVRLTLEQAKAYYAAALQGHPHANLASTVELDELEHAPKPMFYMDRTGDTPVRKPVMEKDGTTQRHSNVTAVARFKGEDIADVYAAYNLEPVKRVISATPFDVDVNLPIDTEVNEEAEDFAANL